MSCLAYLCLGTVLSAVGGGAPAYAYDERVNPDATRRRLIDRIPLKRFARPEDIGRAVLFLASDHAAFITGTSLIVDGGQLAQG